MTGQELDLDAIRERAEAATPGPWCSYEGNLWQGTAKALAAYDADPDNAPWPYGNDSSGQLFHGEPRRPEDAEFIAHAREDVPALLAVVEQLRAALDAIGKERNAWARQMADARDERDAAVAERDDARVNLAEESNARDVMSVNLDDERAAVERLRATLAEANQRIAGQVIGQNAALYGVIAERDKAIAAVERIEALFAPTPDSPCRTTWRDEPSVIGLPPDKVACVEVPMSELRSALDGEG